MNDSALPGSAQLGLVAGIVHLNEREAVWTAMLAGWERQQRSRGVGATTVAANVRIVSRFFAFAGTYPWQWMPGDVEDFTVQLMAGNDRLAPSTIRRYHAAIRSFCTLVTDPRYGWPVECERRFGELPQQICHAQNTLAHLAEYEGKPARRPFTFEEIQRLFDTADDEVARVGGGRTKGAVSALRDAYMVRVAYAYGLRRHELIMLETVDLHRNPASPEYDSFGALHVRFAKGSRGTGPKRRTVLTVPELDWVVESLREWLHYRAEADIEGTVLWPSERGGTMGSGYWDRRFSHIREVAGLDAHLTPHALRHSYVTHLTEFGYPMEFVRQQVGHLYAATTQTYAAVSDDFRQRLIMNSLARINQMGTPR